MNPMYMNRGVDKAVAKVSKSQGHAIRSTTTPIRPVGTISATATPEVGEMISPRHGKGGTSVSSQSRSQDRRPNAWSKACSSTAATSAPTSSPRREDGADLEAPLSCCSREALLASELCRCNPRPSGKPCDHRENWKWKISPRSSEQSPRLPARRAVKAPGSSTAARP